MPATNGLGELLPLEVCMRSSPHLDLASRAAPPLSPAERAIVKSYGDWTSFMHSMGLKPYEFDDIDEAKRILESFVAGDEEGAKQK